MQRKIVIIQDGEDVTFEDLYRESNKHDWKIVTPDIKVLSMRRVLALGIGVEKVNRIKKHKGGM